jgi:SulP family sulfate permease
VPDDTFRHLVHDEQRPACPQLGIMTVRGPLFFGAVFHVEEELRHNHERYPGQRNLMLRMHGVDSCDMSGIEMLESTVKTYRQRGGDVYLVRVREPVLDVMRQSGFLDQTLGADHILPQEGAIEQLFDMVIDPVICTYECEHRVFAECQTVEKHRYGDTVPPSMHPGHARQVPPELFQDLAHNPHALVLDVREPEEYRQAHIEGVKLCPLRRLIGHIDDLPRDRTLLLCCRSGRRTSRALRVLEDQGFEHLYGLRGGIFAWRSSHLPIVADDTDPIPWFREDGAEQCEGCTVNDRS